MISSCKTLRKKYLFLMLDGWCCEWNGNHWQSEVQHYTMYINNASEKKGERVLINAVHPLGHKLTYFAGHLSGTATGKERMRQV